MWPVVDLFWWKGSREKWKRILSKVIFLYLKCCFIIIKLEYIQMVFKDWKSTGKLVIKRSSGVNRPLNFEWSPMSSTVFHTHSCHWARPCLGFWEVHRACWLPHPQILLENRPACPSHASLSAFLLPVFCWCLYLLSISSLILHLHIDCFLKLYWNLCKGRILKSVGSTCHVWPSHSK